MLLSIVLYAAAVLIATVLIRISFGLLRNGAQRIMDKVAARLLQQEGKTDA